MESRAHLIRIASERVDATNRRLLERLPGIVVYEAEIVGSRSCLRYVSPQITTLLGYPAEAFLGESSLWIDRLHPDDRVLMLARLRRRIHENAPFDDEYRLLAADGRVVWIWDRDTGTWEDGAGGPRITQGMVVDITDRKDYEADLQRLALYDPLTGLPNRRLLDDRLRTAFERASRTGSPVGLLLLDLDEFKRVNDTLGHAVGDELLREVARRITLHARDSDTVARPGGDEFIVLAERCERDDGMLAIARRLLDGLSEPFQVAGRRLAMTASVGVAVSEPQDGAHQTILADADTAMYRAKELGPGHVRVFDDSMRDQVTARLNLEADLQQAVERGELHVVYQPKVDVASGRTPWVEALVRWDHPVQGPVSPVAFIPVAEQTGLISRIGAFVRETALRDAARWRAGALADVAVCMNLSAVELIADDLLEEVHAALERHGVPAEALGLEWTETAALRDPRHARANLLRLRDLGCRLSVDDFGTGSASLTHLRDFPADALKIDRSFTAAVEETRGAAFARAIAAMASALGIDAVAEGVETAGQLVAVRALGCRFVQGYVLARPVPADALEGAVEDARRRLVEVLPGAAGGS